MYTQLNAKKIQAKGNVLQVVWDTRLRMVVLCIVTRKDMYRLSHSKVGVVKLVYVEIILIVFANMKCCTTFKQTEIGIQSRKCSPLGSNSESLTHKIPRW